MHGSEASRSCAKHNLAIKLLFDNLALRVAQNLAAVSLFYKLTAKSGFEGV